MKLLVFSMFDRVARQYANPYCAVARGQATRGFGDEINRPAEDNMLYKHAEDFELYFLGEFDSDTGRLSLQDPEFVVSGRDLMNERKEASTPNLRSVN